MAHMHGIMKKIAQIENKRVKGLGTSFKYLNFFQNK
jgi:hypothetical protein